jgi:hypothetical protein
MVYFLQVAPDNPDHVFAGTYKGGPFETTVGGAKG